MCCHFQWCLACELTTTPNTWLSMLILVLGVGAAFPILCITSPMLACEGGFQWIVMQQCCTTGVGATTSMLLGLVWADDGALSCW